MRTLKANPWIAPTILSLLLLSVAARAQPGDDPEVLRAQRDLVTITVGPAVQAEIAGSSATFAVSVASPRAIDLRLDVVDAKHALGAIVEGAYQTLVAGGVGEATLVVHVAPGAPLAEALRVQVRAFEVETGRAVGSAVAIVTVVAPGGVLAHGPGLPYGCAGSAYAPCGLASYPAYPYGYGCGGCAGYGHPGNGYGYAYGHPGYNGYYDGCGCGASHGHASYAGYPYAYPWNGCGWYGYGGYGGWYDAWWLRAPAALPAMDALLAGPVTLNAVELPNGTVQLDITHANGTTESVAIDVQDAMMPAPEHAGKAPPAYAPPTPWTPRPMGNTTAS